MIKILHANFMSMSHIELEFSNGADLVFNLKKYLSENEGPLLIPLHDASYAQKLFIDCGALCWPNGLELSPSRLFEYSQSKKVA